MFPWPMGMVIASLSSHCESGLDSGAQATPPVTAACGENDGQNFFEKHICSGLWRLKILEALWFMDCRWKQKKLLHQLAKFQYIVLHTTYMGPRICTMFSNF